MTDLYDPGFWEQVKPGSVVVLSDAQALLEALRQGLDGEGGLNYEVQRILTLKELNDLAAWILLRLKGADEVWLMVKSVGTEIDLRVYFEVPEFQPGDRADMIDSGMYWLFEDPGPDWKSDYDALRFADAITMDQGESEQKAVSICYRQKQPGPLFAGCREQPAPGRDTYPAAVVEYQTDQVTDNPEMLILEQGGETGQRGGYITLMLGSPVAASDVKVFTDPPKS